MTASESSGPTGSTVPAGQAGPQVLITGGTRGIGAGLVRAFARAGWQVGFTGRSPESVARALASLPPDLAGQVWGRACAADDEPALAAWAQAALERGPIAAVIANAGTSLPAKRFQDHSMAEIRQAINTNLVGVMATAKVFLPLLEARGGFFYAMEGLGSRGEWQPGLTLYGAGKYGMAYLLKALARENRDTRISIGALSPGMVVTDLLLAGSGGLAGLRDLTPSRRRIYGILADKVETVAPWLAGQVIKDMARGPRPGSFRRLAWLTTPKVLGRFALAGFRHRHVLD